MQTANNTSSELPPEATVSSASPTQGGSIDFCLASDQDADMESDAEDPSTSAIQPRRGLRRCQTPDRYASVRGIRSVHGLSHNSSFGTPMLLGLSWAAYTLSQYEASSVCRRGYQHLGKYTNTSPSVSGDGTLVDPVGGGFPLLPESHLD